MRARSTLYAEIWRVMCGYRTCCGSIVAVSLADGGGSAAGLEDRWTCPLAKKPRAEAPFVGAGLPANNGDAPCHLIAVYVDDTKDLSIIRDLVG